MLKKSIPLFALSKCFYSTPAGVTSAQSLISKIEKKRQEAYLGGGESRIKTQHSKVMNLNSNPQLF